MKRFKRPLALFCLAMLAANVWVIFKHAATAWNLAGVVACSIAVAIEWGGLLD